MVRDAIMERLDYIIDQLSRVPSDAEIRHGWSDESRYAVKKLLEQMKSDAAMGSQLKSNSTYVGLARILDHWGIHGGPLLQVAAEIGNLARQL